MNAVQDPSPTSPSRANSKLPSRRQSNRSWISMLASPNVGQHAPSLPPMPYMASPASSEKTITGKVSQVVLFTQDRAPQETRAIPADAAGSSEEGEAETKTVTGSNTEGKGSEDNLLPTLNEATEQPITPPLTANRKSRSMMDGIVSSLRGIPRAVTHNQLHERAPLSRRDSRASHVTVPYSRAGTATAPASPMSGVDPKYQHQHMPFTVPILFAPPFPHHAHHEHRHPYRHGSPAPISVVTESKVDQTFASEWGTESRAFVGRISSFFGELSSLPWISPRVAVDYIPGESQPIKSSSSWYTVSAPSSPSEISHITQFVPEPWFPPARPPPTPVVEVPGEEGNPDAENDEVVKQKLDKIKEELQEKNQALQDLRQVVEHQKKHIGSLETQMEDLRRAEEENMQRRRSSMRRSLRISNSMRVSRLSVRRTSVRVSRPPSSFLD